MVVCGHIKRVVSERGYIAWRPGVNNKGPVLSRFGPFGSYPIVSVSLFQSFPFVSGSLWVSRLRWSHFHLVVSVVEGRLSPSETTRYDYMEASRQNSNPRGIRWHNSSPRICKQNYWKSMWNNLDLKYCYRCSLSYRVPIFHHGCNQPQCDHRFI